MFVLRLAAPPLLRLGALCETVYSVGLHVVELALTHHLVHAMQAS